MIHPNIPFLSIKESKKRGAKFHTDLTSPKSWKLVLLITHDSVWYKDEISGITKKVDVLQNGKIFRISRRYLCNNILAPPNVMNFEKFLF